MAPKKITTPEYQGEVAYAYHLNAGKFAKMRAKHAVAHFSVKHLLANVIDVKMAEDGFVESLITDAHGQLDFDFYVDCSGFSAYLLGRKMQVHFIDKSHQLFVDTALVMQVPTEPASVIPPYTIATAHQAGWIWDVALPTRRGG